MSPKLDVGGTLSRVLELYRQQASVLLPAAAVVFLIPGFAALLFGGNAAAAGLALVVLLIGVVASFWFQGVVVAAVQDMEDGRRDFSIGELFASVRPFVGTLIAAGLLGGIAIGIGFVLLIIPGLILMTWWALLAPVIVLERTGVMAAFRRSRELVRGNAWQVFGIIVVLVVTQALVATILRSIAVGISDTRVAEAIGGYVGNVLVAPLTALAATVVYLRLREAKVWAGSGTAPTDFAPPSSPTPPSPPPPQAPEAPAADKAPTGGSPLPRDSAFGEPTRDQADAAFGERRESIPPPGRE